MGLPNEFLRKKVVNKKELSPYFSTAIPAVGY